MRPQPIVLFERAYLLSVALGVASIAAYWGELRQVAPPLPLAAASAGVLGIAAVLALLVARRRSELSKWILVLFTLGGIALSLPSLPVSLAAGPRGWLGVAQMLLQAAAILFLFTPPARYWLRLRRPPQRLLSAALLRLLIAAALAVPSAARAQEPACSLPATLPRPHAEGPTSREPTRVLPVGGYTLALSWSPEYCRTRQRDPRDRIQCGGANRFGFTLHGLWPDGQGAAWPQYCRPAAVLPEAVIRGAICATPSAQLIQHEWAKHGTCVERDPARYFAAATRAYRGIAYPDMAALSRRPSLSSAALREAFATANPGMSADMIRLNLNRRGWLEEVWLCLDTGRKLRRCPGTDRAGGRTVRIWRGRAAVRG